MKRLLFILTLFISSCRTGVKDPGDEGVQYVLQVDSSNWVIKEVWFDGERIYVLVPDSSNVSIIQRPIPESITYPSGKTKQTVIKIK